MKKVYKYEIIPFERTAHKLLPGDKVLCAREQLGQIYIWVEVDLSSSPNRREASNREFAVIPTGAPIPIGGNYVGTVFMDGGKLVFHVYEVEPV